MGDVYICGNKLFESVVTIQTEEWEQLCQLSKEGCKESVFVEWVEFWNHNIPARDTQFDIMWVPNPGQGAILAPVKGKIMYRGAPQKVNIDTTNWKVLKEWVKYNGDQPYIEMPDEWKDINDWNREELM